MSINHYSSDHPQPQRWSHHMMDSSVNTSSSPNQRQPATCFSTTTAASFFHLIPNQIHRSNAIFRDRNGTVGFDLNNEDDECERSAAAKDGEHRSSAAAMESREEETDFLKEQMFEKSLTPSDVGKLNRLVIPKQHAEKHFPMNGGAAEQSENGLLLAFEDEIGKSWRFRYSYWNSSQSYVLTKGWSRFVKEKRLDAGDIVVFARHPIDNGRFFIGWRRRNSGCCGLQDGSVSQSYPAVANVSCGVGVGRGRLFLPSHYNYPRHHRQAEQSSLPHPPEPLYAGTVVQHHQTTTINGNSKRLRLFGVNMECHQPPVESVPSTPVGSPMSSRRQAYYHAYHHHYYSNNHMVWW